MNRHTSRPPIHAAPFRYLTTRPVPAVLHINHESRLIGLKYYSLEFSWESKDVPSGLEMNVPAKIYYNPEADRICFMGSFLDPLQEQGMDNESLPWSTLWASSGPLSVAINLWPHEHSYGFDEYVEDSHIPDEFGLIFELHSVKEVLLFWESGLEINEEDNILLGARRFGFVEFDTNDAEETRKQRLEIGKALFDRAWREKIGGSRSERAFEPASEADSTSQAEFDSQVESIDQAGFLAISASASFSETDSIIQAESTREAGSQEQQSPVRLRPVVKLVRLMAGGEFPPDPAY